MKENKKGPVHTKIILKPIIQFKINRKLESILKLILKFLKRIL